jgi:hypothetical protein
MVAVLSLSCVAGCDQRLQVRLVKVALPEPRPTAAAYLPEPGYRVIWRNWEGVEELLLAPVGAKSVLLELPKRAGSAVVAYPIYPGLPEWSHPAGGMVPDSLDPSGTLILSWQDGFLAERYHRLSGLGVRMDTVNTPKLMRRIELVAGGEPWALNIGLLESSLATGGLQASSIRCLPRHTVRLELDPGTWLSKSHRVTASGTSPINFEVCVGHHAVVHMETGRLVTFSVDEAGEATTVTTWPRY